MTYSIDDDFEWSENRGRKPGSRNRQTAKRDETIKKAARLVDAGMKPPKAASAVHVEFYGETAVSIEGDCRRQQIDHIAKKIREYRRRRRVG